jgi:AraC-like DNA-binding protein
MQPCLQEQEYISRINRVIDYIQNNLHKSLSLNELARVACFSIFHFHRIFSAIIGETLNDFIQRLRVEKAASLLLSNPKKSITEIAFDCGSMRPSTRKSGTIYVAIGYRKAVINRMIVPVLSVVSTIPSSTLSINTLSTFTCQ